MHVGADGSHIKGKLIHRACTTVIDIWYLVNGDIHWAIIMVTGAHNHLTPLPHKLTHALQDLYEDAIAKVRKALSDMTLTKVDWSTD